MPETQNLEVKAMTGKQSLLVIDDHPLLRRGVAQLVELEPDFCMVGEAQSGEEGIEMALELRPDIILLDLNMKGLSGLETLSRLKQSELDALIIILTVSDLEEDLVAALRLGADGYLLKDAAPNRLLESLRNATEGRMVMDESLTRLLTRAFCDGRSAPGERASSHLTIRERQILNLLTEGLSNKLIGRKLDISDGTVKVHVKNLLRKLKLSSRLEAAVWALRQQDLQP